ncbi:MAG: DUF1398 family protein [Anaerolineae bacterium]
MNADRINQLVRATLADSMPFHEIVGNLMDEGVDYYQVDYVRLQFTFYGAQGVVVAPLNIADLPDVAREFDSRALKSAITDSQQHGQKFGQFSARAMQAGVSSYYAFLTGQRVTYFGRQGDQHTEWFPGAQPEDA